MYGTLLISRYLGGGYLMTSSSRHSAAAAAPRPRPPAPPTVQGGLSSSITVSTM